MKRLQVCHCRPLAGVNAALDDQRAGKASGAMLVQNE